MAYKETLFFIGKCLTITHEEHNKILVENELKSYRVDWDSVVKVSTAHYVFPALYCNLKRANFLHYLPSDLVEYMKHITDLNRERNQQIIEQAKEINNLLLSNNIIPIFIKGTGNLLEGLYEDIAERMVGDIDFLVKGKDLEKTNRLLIINHYKSFISNFDDHRHLPRLVKENKIAAVEIHKELIEKKFSSYFDYSTIHKEIINKNGAYILSYKNQIELSVFALQINDNGYYFNRISLKHSYDVFLISLKNKENININDPLFKYLNSYLALSSYIFDTKNIKFKKTHITNQYVAKSINRIGKSRKLLNKYLNFKTRSKILLKSTFDKSYRNYLTNKIFNISWLKSKLSLKPNP